MSEHHLYHTADGDLVYINAYKWAASIDEHLFLSKYLNLGNEDKRYNYKYVNKINENPCGYKFFVTRKGKFRLAEHKWITPEGNYIHYPNSQSYDQMFMVLKIKI